MYTHIFSPINVGGIVLKNRVTMAPLYLGYRFLADEWLPTVSGLKNQHSDP